MTRGKVIQEELEAIRVRREKLHQQQADLEGMLRDSRQWLGLDDRHFRDALSASLEILGAKPLEPLDPNEVVRDSERARLLPALDPVYMLLGLASALPNLHFHCIYR